MYHRPVLLEEAVAGLKIVPGGTYVDATFGGGGHSRRILAQLDNGRLFAFDQDAEAGANAPDDSRLRFLNQNFRFMQNFLRFHGVTQVDGVMADLGVSSHQFDQAGRGFSTRLDGPLDMRMDKEGASSAREVVNDYGEEELASLFRQYGELRNARAVARLIAGQRAGSPILTTDQLARAVAKAAPRGRENQFLARVFQAIRIEVNQELQALKELLEQSREVIRPGGRLVVISYHSLEDRLVKLFMRAGNFGGEVQKDFYGKPQVPFKQLGKALSPGPEEVTGNPRARSARLRIAERQDR
jgi:16S rRNA (cytosine1402-N4)-methyltransferase